MLKKEEIIKGLENDDFDVRAAVYKYVCNLHLYDDKEITENLIEIMADRFNFNVIPYALKYIEEDKILDKEKFIYLVEPLLK